MIDVSYENLFQIIQPSLPEDWEKLIVRAFFVEVSCHIKYYIKQNNGQVCDCFSLNYSQRQILQIIANIHQEVASVRARLTGKNRWNALTVMISRDGSFHADFDYSETTWNTDKEWLERYLNN